MFWSFPDPWALGPRPLGKAHRREGGRVAKCRRASWRGPCTHLRVGLALQRQEGNPVSAGAAAGARPAVGEGPVATGGAGQAGLPQQVAQGACSGSPQPQPTSRVSGRGAQPWLCLGSTELSSLAGSVGGRSQEGSRGRGPGRSVLGAPVRDPDFLVSGCSVFPHWGPRQQWVCLVASVHSSSADAPAGRGCGRPAGFLSSGPGTGHRRPAAVRALTSCVSRAPRTVCECTGVAVPASLDPQPGAPQVGRGLACELGMLSKFLKCCNSKNKKRGKECATETTGGPWAKDVTVWPSGKSPLTGPDHSPPPAVSESLACLVPESNPTAAARAPLPAPAGAAA